MRMTLKTTGRCSLAALSFPIAELEAWNESTFLHSVPVLEEEQPAVWERLLEIIDFHDDVIRVPSTFD